MIIDTNGWDDFYMDELFDIHPTAMYKINNSQLFEENGINPVVANSVYNNGIVAYSNKPTTEKAGMVTFSDTVSRSAESFFYQPNDFIGYAHIQGLYPKKWKDKWNEQTYNFLISVIKAKALTKNADYRNKLTRDIVKKMSIKLPVSGPHIPDWNYMEKYMFKIESVARDNIFALMKTKNAKKPLNIEGWEEFHLPELFKIDTGSKLDKVKMDTSVPEINFVGRSNANNGITAVIKRIDDLKPYKAGNLTLALGGAYLGSCFVQSEDFYTSQNVDVLIPLSDEMTFWAKQFIATAIFVESQNNYEAFIKELNSHVKTDFVIKLPTSAQHIPNWYFMDNYMKGIYKKAQEKIKILTLRP